MNGTWLTRSDNEVLGCFAMFFFAEVDLGWGIEKCNTDFLFNLLFFFLSNFVAESVD